MNRLTAFGRDLSVSAVVAGFAAAVKDPFEAGVAATAVYGVAGELAAATAAGGPATFRSNFLDLLARLDGDTVARTLRVVA